MLDHVSSNINTSEVSMALKNNNNFQKNSNHIYN